MPNLLARLLKRAVKEIRLSAMAWPLFLRRDILYVWASFRLRRRPIKAFFWVLLLGAFCWCLQWAGDKWVAPPMQAFLAKLDMANIQKVFIAGMRRAFIAAVVIACIAAIAWGRRRLKGRNWALLGLYAGACAAAGLIYWKADRRVSAAVVDWCEALGINFPQGILLRASEALFSSLNLLSCLSIFVVVRSLRHLHREGHIEDLMLVPGRFRPSALFYAISTRYIPLGFAAVLVMYLNPERTPFNSFPFQKKAQAQATGLVTLGAGGIGGVGTRVRMNLGLPDEDKYYLDPRALRWPAIREAAVLAFCATNLMMDIAIGFWVMMRWRASFFAASVAVVFVGLVEPLLIMAVHELTGIYYARHSTAVFNNPFTPEHVKDALHYLVNAGLSVGFMWLMLRNLDARWSRQLDDPKCDPVFMRG